jgi:protein involved in polysaccharide export with SLBB domain
MNARIEGTWSCRALRATALGAHVLVVVAALGCGPAVNSRPLSSHEIASLREEAQQRLYRILPGDTLAIDYPYHPEMKQQEVVRPDGTITATLAGELPVAGLTTAQLEQRLVRATSEELKNPEVVVRIAQFAERRVFVGGEVGKPGPVTFQVGLTPFQAIVAAGGLRDTARLDSVVLVRTDGAGQIVMNRTLDLERLVADGAGEMVPLAPQDVLYVPRTAIANANVWVRQHVTELFPFIRGSSVPLVP